MENAEWYVDWFNSPYYHLLYNNRDEEEANFFIDNLCSKLALRSDSKIWDLACGKGRHAIALNNKGFNVIGTDLATNSIQEASESANDKLQFFIHDMREPFKVNYFDAVFNLFTSIGYFKDPNDNYLVFQNVALALKKNGEFVVDFFNADKVVRHIEPEYKEVRGEITFEIKKTISNNSIVKRIEFSDEGHNYYFEETVSLLRKNDFMSFAKNCGLELHYTFGNYHFEPFDPESSDRLILIFKK